MEPPKKKRKLLIVDIGEDGKPIATMSTPPQRLEGIGTVHKELQQYILKLSEHYKFEEEIDGEIWKKVDKVLEATTQEEANAFIKAASEHAIAFFQGAGASSPGR